MISTTISQQKNPESPASDESFTLAHLPQPFDESRQIEGVGSFTRIGYFAYPAKEPSAILAVFL